MRIGFLMGSFDPIHIGHVNMIRSVLNSNAVDKVVVVPSGHNPWKQNDPAPFELRLQMIREAIRPFGDRCEVSDIESTFEPPYTSNKPLGHFKEAYGSDERYIICGSDTVKKIPRWKNFETEINPFYGIIELARESSSENKGSYVMHYFASDGTERTKAIKVVKTNVMSVSSTEIREAIARGDFAYPLIDMTTLSIIKRNNIYGKEN